MGQIKAEEVPQSEALEELTQQITPSTHQQANTPTRQNIKNQYSKCASSTSALQSLVKWHVIVVEKTEVFLQDSTTTAVVSTWMPWKYI